MKHPRIEIKRARNKEFYGVIIASNGKMLWKTSETYKRRAGVLKAIGRTADIVGCECIYNIEIIDTTKKKP